MKYIYSYRFLFESPNWLMNLLAAIVCVQFVPVVGPIVMLGYAFEIIESLHRSKGAPYPDFDLNQLMKYLTRGLWPFLVQLVVMLPFTLVLMVFGCCLGMGMSLGHLQDRASALFAVLMVVFYLAILVLIVAISFIMVPFTLRAGLIQDFKPAFSLDFVKDFFARVWLETLLAQLFLFWSSIVLSLAGLLVCGIGIFPASGLIVYAHYHLLHQVYELYLERGGTPIPLKPEPVTAQAADSAMDALPPDAPPLEGFKAPDQP